jgi:hypothetical protein
MFEGICGCYITHMAKPQVQEVVVFYSGAGIILALPLACIRQSLKRRLFMEATMTGSSTPYRWSLQDHPWRTEIKLLFLSAMVIFVFTVVTGLINGQHVMTLGSNVILTHVHAGTLGWITLSVFAFGLWLFGEGATHTEKNTYIRTLSILSAFAFPLYILAFLSGNFVARAVFGVPVLLAMAGFLGWIVVQLRQLRFGLAQLAMLYATITLLLGGLVGVLLQFQFALGTAFLPVGAFGAHPAMMVTGYLVLIGAALTERTLIPETRKISRAGIVQMTLFFLAGLSLAAGLLFDMQALLGANLLFSILGVGIYLVRVAPLLPHVGWLRRGSERFFALSALFIVADIALTAYLVVSLVTGAFPNGEAPSNLLVALDHTMFIGVMTNAIFGMIQDATWERRAFLSWADDVLFWGMNVGVIGFVLSLITNARMLIPVFTPIMGLSILVGLVVYALQMRTPGAAEIKTEARQVDALRP